MIRFVPRTITLRGSIITAASIEAVFPLFSPEGEKLWVPGWSPEYVAPPERAWEEGQIFRTQEESGEAIWLVSRLDRTRHRATYHRVEPGRYVARIEVASEALGEHRTRTTISYSFVGLSEGGNRDIDAMTQVDYDAKMSRWTEWIDRHLAAGDGTARALP